MSHDHATTEADRDFGISYAKLPGDCYAQVAPTPVAAPKLLKLNCDLARDLGLSVEWLASPEGVATLAGNRALAGVDPLATAYAGHQFGNWVPSLGDGRAIQIGEARDRSGIRRDIQLKGSGPTPFSRGGDGRAAIGPVLREYVLSEAMFALGIPTTRALGMVTTGEPVYRERAEPGAILTRVAAGFVRVGTFQYFHGRAMTDHVRALADYVIERQNPSAMGGSNPYRELLAGVIDRQAALIARWMLVGFIHGVMNTDNMSITGETIDYGPCAFMDEYEPGKVFSSIDRNGRYAYQQQPNVGLWNLTRFAETLVPLLADDETEAVESAKAALDHYPELFHRYYGAGLLEKMGLVESNDENRAVASAFLELLAAGRADFTLCFRRLSTLHLDDPAGDEAVRSLFADPAPFDAWSSTWRERLRTERRDDASRNAGMQAVNPAFIARNHRVAQSIEALENDGDSGPLDALLTVTGSPYTEHAEFADYESPPAPHEVVHQTFCGT